MHKKNMRLTEGELKRAVARSVKRILREYGERANYEVVWEFCKKKSDSQNGATRAADKGAKRFSNEEEAYQFFLEQMHKYEGFYAVTFRFTRNGQTIEDLSGTKVFGGRINKHETFDSEWRRDQRTRPSEEDPTPYGSYRDYNGKLKAPMQEPIPTEQPQKERTVQDIEKQKREIEKIPMSISAYYELERKWYRLFYDFFKNAAKDPKIREILKKHKIIDSQKKVTKIEKAQCFVEVLYYLIPKFQNKFATNGELKRNVVTPWNTKHNITKELAGNLANKAFVKVFTNAFGTWLYNSRGFKLKYVLWFRPGRPKIIKKYTNLEIGYAMPGEL